MIDRHEEQTFDLAHIISTPIENRICLIVVEEMLSHSPFLPVPSALNIRDISVPQYVRQGLVYWFDELSHITPSGQSILAKQYGIQIIFDLRTSAERERGPSPDLEGIETR